MQLKVEYLQFTNNFHSKSHHGFRLSGKERCAKEKNTDLSDVPVTQIIQFERSICWELLFLLLRFDDYGRKMFGGIDILFSFSFSFYSYYQ